MKWFLLLLIGLYVLWLLSGGPERTDNKDKPYLQQPEGQVLPEATDSFR